MAARADSVSRVDHDGVTLVEGATHDVRFALPNAPAVFPKMRTPHSTWARMLAMTPLPFKKIVAAHSRPWVPPSASTTCLFPIKYTVTMS